MPASASQSSHPSPEAELRAGMAEWQASFRANDVDGMMKHYADDVRVFDIGAPLQYRGKDTLREKWLECFQMFGGTMQFEMRELDIDADNELAHCNCLNRVSGTINGMNVSNWVRVSSCHRKTNGVWKITHEHVSVCADMKTGTVAFNLEP